MLEICRTQGGGCSHCICRHLRSARCHYLVVTRQSQLVWASSICRCRPNCLELSERWSAWSDA